VLVVDYDRALRHALVARLKSAGFSANGVGDGPSALIEIREQLFDLIILDPSLPRASGLDVLTEIQKLQSPPKVIVVTADDTPRAMLQAIRENAHQYIVKPASPETIVKSVVHALAAVQQRPIEVISARPDWVELLVPCDLEAAERIQGFLQEMGTDLSQDVRDSAGVVFRELLMNAVEWGGQLDSNRSVRIACLRGRHMLLYRIADPGPGFSPDQIPHAAIGSMSANSVDHMRIREQLGLRSGGFGLLLTRKLADEFISNEAHNEVVFVKYLDQ
jgi:DNA-binding response OmpR family regulator